MKKALPAIILLSLLLFATGTVFNSISNIAAQVGLIGAIRITPEGAVEGTDKISQNGDTYTLTGDISVSIGDGSELISIERDGVTLDGAGKTIMGTNGGVAIGIYGTSNVTIKNLRVVNFGVGLNLYTNGLNSKSTAENNRIIDNYFETKYWAIDLRGVKGLVSGNTFVSKNNNFGVLFWANETCFTNNMFINGGLNFNDPVFSYSNVFSGNTINGKPLLVLEGQANRLIDDASQVVLINCRNMVIQNMHNAGIRQSIVLYGTTGTRIADCSARSVQLTNSHSNIIINNNLSETAFMGGYGTAPLELTGSHNNTVTHNFLTGTGCNGAILSNSGYNRIEQNTIFSDGSDRAGIQLLNCEYNYIYENNITAVSYGLQLQSRTQHNVFYKNTVYYCQDSILLSDSLFNAFLGNTFSGASNYAAQLACSDYNNFIWNNFQGDNKFVELHQTYAMTLGNGSYYAEHNQWDNGKEGNYWSDYTGQDTNGDGIGETPYHVYENFTDNYPLTEPYNTSQIQVTFKEWVPSASLNLTIPAGGFKTISPSPENKAPLDHFPLASVVVVSGLTLAMTSGGLLWYFKKKPKE